MAAAWGVDFVEPDVVLSRDGIPVVLHDIDRERSTEVRSKFPTRHRADGRFYVRDFSLAELKKLHVLERGRADDETQATFPERFPRTHNLNSFRIPTLEEYLEFVEGLRRSTGHKLGVYPEIKAPEFHESEGQDIVAIVHALLIRFGYDKTPELIYLQSFDPKALKRLKNDFSSPLPLIQLIGKNSWKESSADYDALITEKGLKEVSSYAVGIGPSLDQILSYDSQKKKIRVTELPKWARQAGLKIHPYTHRREQIPPIFKNSDEFFSLLKYEAKVDGLFSDFADDVLRWEGRLLKR